MKALEKSRVKRRQPGPGFGLIIRFLATHKVSLQSREDVLDAVRKILTDLSGSRFQN